MLIAYSLLEILAFFSLVSIHSKSAYSPFEIQAQVPLAPSIPQPSPAFPQPCVGADTLPVELGAGISSQICAQWLHFGILKSIKLDMYKSRQSANATNKNSSPRTPSFLSICQHLLGTTQLVTLHREKTLDDSRTRIITWKNDLFKLQISHEETHTEKVFATNSSSLSTHDCEVLKFEAV